MRLTEGHSEQGGQPESDEESYEAISDPDTDKSSSASSSYTTETEKDIASRCGVVLASSRPSCTYRPQGGKHLYRCDKRKGHGGESVVNAFSFRAGFVAPSDSR